MIACSGLMSSLPHHRHQAMPDTLPVFRVSRQIPRQDPLFVQEPPQQERRHPGKCQEAPVRAERKRRAEHVERSARVHRMTPTAYGPVAITVWPAETSIVAAVKVFSRYTRKMK